MSTRLRIRAAIRETGPGTADDLALDTGLRHKTVGTTLSRMLARGEVRVTGVHQPHTGRPARIFDLARG